MKIALIANDTTYTYNLRDVTIKSLVSGKHDVVVAVKMLNYQDELRALGCSLYDINVGRHSKNPFADIVLLCKYLRFLRKERPDVALTFNIKPNVYAGLACRLTGTRYLANITGLGTALEYPGFMQIITKKLYKLGISGAECVFFQNEENSNFFKKNKLLSKKNRTYLLPGSGVNLSVHKKMPYTSDSTINFLFIARIMKEKGADLYLNAAKRIHDRHKNVMFHICGYCDDPRYVTLLDAAQKEGYIKYHGEQKNMLPFFEMAHCIVHPSYYPEGMSNVLLEAAAHCRPIITTDRSGCRETVDDGKSGYVIPIKNEDALVEAIEKFMAMSWDERREMGLAGRAKIEKEFDRKIVAEVYMSEINA